MKILNLLEDKEQVKKYNGDLVRRLHNMKPINFNKKKELGAGQQASTKDDPSDEHMVVRHNHRPQGPELPQDGFRKLLKVMKENDLMDDPHFIKLYGITKIVGKDGNYIYKYKLEKLIKWTSLSEEEMEAIINTHFNGNMDIGEADQNIIDAMLETIEDYLEYGKNQDAFNGTFKESLKKLKHVYENHLAGSEDDILYFDLHAGNMMVRRSPVGLQLVFTDIFA